MAVDVSDSVRLTIPNMIIYCQDNRFFYCFVLFCFVCLFVFFFFQNFVYFNPNMNLVMFISQLCHVLASICFVRIYIIFHVVVAMFTFTFLNCSLTGHLQVHFIVKTDVSCFASCSKTCHCQNGILCDVASGQCPGSCEQNWVGVACQKG